MNWVVFFAVLLAPPVLTSLVVLCGGTHGKDSGVGMALVGGTAGGIICGGLLSRRIGKTAPAKFILGVVFAAALSVLCIGMSCFGCLASGYRLDLR